jgi:serine phosphatase RsbU (regulator of sigma subunit)/pSer/pThr/pTyr-binding forkhead associated (FHA) protein
MEAMARLVVRGGPELGREFSLPGDRAIIGRDPDVAVSLPSRTVSRHHAQIWCEHGDYSVEDLASRNGTYLNGKRLERRTPLAPRDQLRVGEFTLEFIPPSTVSLEEADLVIREQVEADPANPDLYALHPAEKLRVVLEIAQELGSNLEVQPLLDNLLGHLLRLFSKADRGLVLLFEEGRLVVRAGRSRRPADGEGFPFSRTVVNKSLNEGVGILSEDVRVDARFDQSRSLEAADVRSLLCVPLIGKEDRGLGVIQLDRATSSDPFQGEDLRLLTTLGLQVAVVLENVALQADRLREVVLRKELSLAREVQQGFLPAGLDPRSLPGCELYAHVQPARVVSGDFYDFFLLDDGRLTFFVGDVAGKGIPAALFMVAVVTLGRHLAGAGVSPAETLCRLNDALATHNSSSLFVTLAQGIYDPRTGAAVLASGGHPRPLLRHADGRIAEIAAPPGRVLGMAAGDLKLTETHLVLALGETLIYYTDGFTEAQAPDGRTLFGRERLAAVLGDTASRQCLDDWAEHLRAAVRQFTGSAELQDDQTLLLLRRV